MIIRHSIQLLEQLSELEEHIHHLERLAQAQGLSIESELLLKIAFSHYVTKAECNAVSLTSGRKVS